MHRVPTPSSRNRTPSCPITRLNQVASQITHTSQKPASGAHNVQNGHSNRVTPLSQSRKAQSFHRVQHGHPSGRHHLAEDHTPSRLHVSRQKLQLLAPREANQVNDTQQQRLFMATDHTVTHSSPITVIDSPQHVFNSTAFRSSTPSHSLARALVLGGVISIGVGARYIVRGVLAFKNAYKATKEHLEPPSLDKIDQLQEEIAEAAQAILDRETEWDENESRKSERRRTAQYQKERNINQENKFHNDDMSMHYDPKEEERKLHAFLDKFKDYMPPEDFNLKLLLDRYDPIFQAGPFEDPMSVLEAEKILAVSPSPCREEVEDRYRCMMRLNHPDFGGSMFLTRKINEARELYIQRGVRSDPKWKMQQEAKRQQEVAEKLKRAEEFARQQAEKRGEHYTPPGEEPPHPDKL